MKNIAAIAVLLALACPAEAQGPSGGTLPARSVSGQFVVYSAPPSFYSRYASNDKSFISLEPALLVVSCERIKQSLGRELGPTTPWQGKIYLQLHRARTAGDRTPIVAERKQNGWAYHVDLPDCLEQTRFVRAIVHVLLLELANRNADTHSAEIPAWLTEGLVQELLATDGLEFILPPPRAMENGLALIRMNVNERRRDPLEQALLTLRSRPPLTFEQLSWPTEEQFSGDAGATYRSSAQLFVNQLLQLKDGPACLRAMLDELPRRYNWQFAFLGGFQPYFQRQLDVEKWWALQLVQFAGRDLTQTWTPEESWNKLDEALHARVEVRQNPGELPLRSELTLQTIIREWDALRQSQVIQRRLQDLNSLRLRVAQDLVSLVDDYRGVLGTYLKERKLSGPIIPFKDRRLANRSADEAIRQLNALDARREALRPAAATPLATTTAKVISP